jgi:hypothetical protein
MVFLRLRLVSIAGYCRHMQAVCVGQIPKTICPPVKPLVLLNNPEARTDWTAT